MSQFTPNYMSPDPNNVPPTGMAIASMCCGIGSLGLVCIPCLGILSIPAGIVGVVLGYIAISRIRRGEAGGKGMAITGMICGSVALLIYLVVIGFMIFMGIVNKPSSRITIPIAPTSSPSVPWQTPQPTTLPVQQ